jgi:hypothetical protein
MRPADMQCKCRSCWLTCVLICYRQRRDRFRGYVDCVMEAHFDAINVDSRARSKSLQESLRGRLDGEIREELER